MPCWVLIPHYQPASISKLHYDGQVFIRSWCRWIKTWVNQTAKLRQTSWKFMCTKMIPDVHEVKTYRFPKWTIPKILCALFKKELHPAILNYQGTMRACQQFKEIQASLIHHFTFLFFVWPCSVLCPIFLWLFILYVHRLPLSLQQPVWWPYFRYTSNYQTIKVLAWSRVQFNQVVYSFPGLLNRNSGRHMKTSSMAHGMALMILIQIIRISFEKSLPQHTWSGLRLASAKAEVRLLHLIPNSHHPDNIPRPLSLTSQFLNIRQLRNIRQHRMLPTYLNRLPRYPIQLLAWWTARLNWTPTSLNR